MSSIYLTPAIAFAFVLARVGGLVIAAPLFGAHVIPKNLRIVLAIALALVITPTQWSAAVDLPENGFALAVQWAGELLIGLILGLGVAILLAGVRMAGQVLSQMSGISLAESFSPGDDLEMPITSNLLYLVTLTLFVSLGGHRLLFAALLDTYAAMPIGHAAVPNSLVGLVCNLLSESFSLAVRGAAPVMVALLLGTIVLGMLGRTLPQLNILTFGFGLNAILLLGVLAISINTIAWLFQDQLGPAISTILSSLRGAPI